MRTKFIISIIVLLFCFAFTIKKKCIQPDVGKSPLAYINNNERELKEGTAINCRKIKDLGVIVYFNDRMKTFDVFQIELHRFGADADVMVGFKTFLPSSKEFEKKYSTLDSLKLRVLTYEDGFNTSDFEVNTLLFAESSYVNDVFCTYKDKIYCNFYFIVKGYNKTGKINKFKEPEFDKGKELTGKSVVFKNWEDKTK